MKCNALVIDPHNCKCIKYWDLFSGVLLVFVAFEAPYEAGFRDATDSGSHQSVNLAISMFFFFDLILQFFLPYSINTRYGEQFVFHHCLIAKRYLKTWFIIDLISIIPFEMLNPGKGLASVKIVRLIRLLKLLRLLRGSRMIHRWQAEVGISYRKTLLYQLFFGAIAAAHWFACTLGITSRIQNANGICNDTECVNTWLTGARESQISDSWTDYTLALHASMSILVHPHTYAPATNEERMVFVVLMLIGGFLWTQVISRSTTICTSLDRHAIDYRQTMDDVNTLSKKLLISKDMRMRLRNFFVMEHMSSEREVWAKLVKRMSPQLKRDAFREVNKRWVNSIPFMKSFHVAIMTEVAQAMELQMFSEQEYFGEPFHMYVMAGGLASRGKLKVMATGMCWGEDHLLLSNQELLHNNTAVALVVVSAQVLGKKSFNAIIIQYPEQYKVLRRAVIACAFKRGVRKVLANMTFIEQVKAATSFVHVEGDLPVHIQDTMQRQRRRTLESLSPSAFAESITLGTMCYSSESPTAADKHLGLEDLREKIERLVEKQTEILYKLDEDRKLQQQIIHGMDEDRKLLRETRWMVDQLHSSCSSDESVARYDCTQVRQV